MHGRHQKREKLGPDGYSLELQAVGSVEMSNRGADTQIYGVLRVEPGQRLLSYEDRQMKLGARELDLLTTLLRHRDRVVSYKQLNSQIWGLNQPELTRCLRLTILRLRRKLITEHMDEIQISNVGRVGYRARIGSQNHSRAARFSHADNAPTPKL